MRGARRRDKSEENMSRRGFRGCAIVVAAVAALLLPSFAMAQNQVLGQVDLVGKTKVEKTAGVWVDGQYLGYVQELNGDKKILLLPGEHEIDVRQTGYLDQQAKITVEPGKTSTIAVSLERDPKAEFPTGPTAQVKLKVTPDRAAVFVDEKFAGTIKDFGGIGRAMVIAPGKHHVRIALAGYQDFTTEINLRPDQKITIKTDLIPGSISQAGPAIKSN